MKHLSILLSALLLALMTSCGERPVEARLMCYNVHNCVGLDDSLSCERIAKIINYALGGGRTNRYVSYLCCVD